MCDSNLVTHHRARPATAALSEHDLDPATAGCAHADARHHESGGCKPQTVDFEFPPVPLPSSRVFAVAGVSLIYALVERHHERLRASTIGHLFPCEPARFREGVERSVDFVVEKTGGPPAYAPPDGVRCMRTRHFAFTIDERGREIWLAELIGAMDDVEFPGEIREEYWNWVEAMSIRMVNRRTMRAAPARYPWKDAARMLAESPEARPPVLAG